MKRCSTGGTFVSLAAAIAVSLLAAAAALAQQDGLPEGYIRPAPVQPGRAPGMEVEQRPAAAQVYEVGFTDGDEILSGLVELAATHGVTSAQVTGLGGLASATLGFGDPSVGAFAFREIRVDEKSELVSLVGNVSMRDGEPYVHVHAVLALADGSTRGGHLIEAHVAPVAEVTVVATATSAAQSPP